MAVFIPSGKPSSQAGFTYLGVLLMIALMGIGLTSVGELWSSASRRDRERQLLWVGTQYAQALRSYYRSSPGVAQYPKALEDLLQDERFPTPAHHLRQLYPDPIGGGEWTLMRGFDGRITGLYSPATDLPLKQADFPPQWSDFVGMASYQDWQFVAEKAFLDGASGPAQTRSAAPKAITP
ncbi:type II secretion system protein [Pseudomonas sp. MF6772]|jgi:type II secretory pathway pseudopilin PulG|uniref:type II secretion system protein n=1 Tax=unclassified Pseudomonas TaxID=196821 RepID=UPI00070FDDE9|nr:MULTISPECIES: type II secretion system protein [unclassified Pseudomonas]MBJ2267255.1 type II secretion system protein [Pseudomonas sp. MF6772]MBL7226939.1 type II secretion system protein [Pseudomonas sp.]